MKTLHFELPEALTRSIPTEVRGIERDQVKLMVSQPGTDRIYHSTFHCIDRFLHPGDTLVVNTSATIPAALDIILPNREGGRLHLSNRLGRDKWLGELRQWTAGKSGRYYQGQSGNKLSLPGRGTAILLRPHYGAPTKKEHLHLWQLRLQIPEHWKSYLHHYGKPIRYDRQNYPIEYYQTNFGSEAGSAEMPSAGRAFTHALITRLIVQGVQFAPILLHTGVSSLETNERPFPEFFRIPATSANFINRALEQKRRIIAIGTTSLRAVESAVNEQGFVETKAGWTNRYITPDNGPRVVTGLLTGFHEPRASHLQMLQALAGFSHLEKAYRAAIDNGYFWHEFGDLHLMV